MNQYVRYTLIGLGAFFVCVALLFGFLAVGKSYSRYQKRADAKNRVKVSEIEIRNQAQRVQIEKQRAEIRFVESTGIKRAQVEIAKTLTPLYVAHEMTQAMEDIATSGTNNTIIYLPTNPNTGLPIVPTSNLSKP